MDDTAKKPRPVSPYDEATPEKIAFGQRMREAREISGMSQAEAAAAMNYSQAVQLSQMESGHRMPTARVLIACAILYGTTMDYLCGLVEDSDRDPALALQRELGAMMDARIKQMISGMVVASVDVVRDVLPSIMECARLAEMAREVNAALKTVRERNPKFDDSIRGGNTLAAKVEVLNTVAMQFLANVERTKRLTSARTMRDARDNAANHKTTPQLSLLPALDLIRT